METQNKTALITGATSGIGLELAKLFAEDKYNLVIIARKFAMSRVMPDSMSAENMNKQQKPKSE